MEKGWVGGWGVCGVFQFLMFDDINVGGVVLGSAHTAFLLFQASSFESEPFRLRIPVRSAGIPQMSQQQQQQQQKPAEWKRWP